MMFAGTSLSAWGLGSIMQDPGAITDPTSLQAILTEINGVDHRAFVQMNSLSIQDTLGQPVTASFTILNPSIAPAEGETIRVLFHSQVIFSGTIDRVGKTTSGLQVFSYRCECKDFSQVLERRIIRRNFTDVTVQSLLDSLLDNELTGELLTLGTIDSRATLPLVDAQNARAFDVCRTVAGTTGQTFYVDYDRSIQMRSTTVSASPLLLTESVVEIDGTTVQSDRETYRNHQTVVVTGTPANTTTEALSVIVERKSTNQIALRQEIEGGTGRYDAIDEVTHPTSNDPVKLALMGVGYANLRLALSGTLRQTVQCKVRSYGFRAGQVASVNLPTFGLIGTYVIQRVTIREENGVSLVHTLELTSSSLQQRAYESWLSIVKAGKVTVQLPGFVAENLETFITTGSDTWTVPAGVTLVEVTCYGAGGGGGGASQSWTQNFGTCYNTQNPVGGHAGDGGKAVTVVEVVEGQVLDIVVGAAGTPGINGSKQFYSWPSPGDCTAQVTATGGVDGGFSLVQAVGVTVCQGNGGFKGTPAVIIYDVSITAGVDGADGSGLGDGVTLGGGSVGGVRGVVGVAPTGGLDGKVEVRW
jgi:hypothetical protein